MQVLPSEALDLVWFPSDRIIIHCFNLINSFADYLVDGNGGLSGLEKLSDIDADRFLPMVFQPKVDFRLLESHQAPYLEMGYPFLRNWANNQIIGPGKG